MILELDIIENATDSLNESLRKYTEGQNGDLKAHKFAILHMAHFLELTLKTALFNINENLVFTKVFKEVEKYAKNNEIDLLAAYHKMAEENCDFESFINPEKPHTIKVDQAIKFGKCFKCPVTEVAYLDQALNDDIKYLKDIRNEIEHFKFSFNSQEVRLCLGRLIRDISSYIDCLDLFNLEEKIHEDCKEIFHTLSDEYEQHLKEAKITVEGERVANEHALNSLSPKDRMIDGHLYEWKVYDCQECGAESMMIRSEESLTGYKCAICGNEDSEDIEVACEQCGCELHQDELSLAGDFLLCPDCHPSRWMG